MYLWGIAAAGTVMLMVSLSTKRGKTGKLKRNTEVQGSQQVNQMRDDLPLGDSDRGEIRASPPFVPGMLFMRPFALLTIQNAERRQRNQQQQMRNGSSWETLSPGCHNLARLLVATWCRHCSSRGLQGLVGKHRTTASAMSEDRGFVGRTFDD